jgi:hypothetical protein
LNRYEEWAQLEALFKLGKYDKFKDMKLSYELCLGFAVQATKASIINKHFLPALTTAIKWLRENYQVPSIVYQELKPLLEKVKIHSSHSLLC